MTTPDRRKLEAAKAAARAEALSEAAALCSVYENQRANIAFLQRTLARRAEAAWNEYDALTAYQRELEPVT